MRMCGSSVSSSPSSACHWACSASCSRASNQLGNSKPAPSVSLVKRSTCCSSWRSTAGGRPLAQLLDRRADQRAEPIDLQRPEKTLGKMFGDARQPHAVGLAERLETPQVLIGHRRGSLGDRAAPDLGSPFPAATHQRLVRDRHRLEVPRQPVVARPQPQEIEQRVQHVAAIRLRGDAVVIEILAVVLDHGLDGDSQPVRRVVERNGGVQFGQQAEGLLGLGLLRAAFPGIAARPGAECRGGCRDS